MEFIMMALFTMVASEAIKYVSTKTERRQSSNREEYDMCIDDVPSTHREHIVYDDNDDTCDACDRKDTMIRDKDAYIAKLEGELIAVYKDNESIVRNVLKAHAESGLLV